MSIEGTGEWTSTAPAVNQSTMALSLVVRRSEKKRKPQKRMTKELAHATLVIGGVRFVRV